MCCLFVFCTGFFLFCHFEAAGWIYSKKCYPPHKSNMIKGSTQNRLQVRCDSTNRPLRAKKISVSPQKNQFLTVQKILLLFLKICFGILMPSSLIEWWVIRDIYRYWIHINMNELFTIWRNALHNTVKRELKS